MPRAAPFKNSTTFLGQQLRFSLRRRCMKVMCLQRQVDVIFFTFCVLCFSFSLSTVESKSVTNSDKLAKDLDGLALMRTSQ